MKNEQITTVFTSLTSGGGPMVSPEDSQVGVSSLMDVWLLLRNSEINGERNRTLYVLKARGMHHSNQVREFRMGDDGIDLVDVFLGANGVLTGSARLAQEAQENAAMTLRAQNHQRKLRQLASRRKAVEAQIARLQAEVDAEEAEVNFTIAQERLQEKDALHSSKTLAAMRGGRCLNQRSGKHP